MEALRLDEEVLAEVVPGAHDVLAAEAPVVLDLDFPFDQDEEPPELEAVELHLVELEGVLLEEGHYPAPAAVALEVVFVLADLLGVDKAGVDQLLAEAEAQPLLAQQLVAVGAVVEEDIPTAVGAQVDVFTEEEEGRVGQPLEQPHIFQEVVLVVQLECYLPLPEQSEFGPRYANDFNISFRQEPVVGAGTEVTVDVPCANDSSLPQHYHSIGVGDALLMAEDRDQPVDHYQALVLLGEDDGILLYLLVGPLFYKLFLTRWSGTRRFFENRLKNCCFESLSTN